MRSVVISALAVALGIPNPARATGHGPVYGLSTPTLGQGGWSLDVGGMYRLMGDVTDQNGQAAMLRPMVG